MINYKLSKSIVLIGVMGAGKSSIGRRIAEEVNVKFVDSDEEIELADGMSVSEIFASFGVLYFRSGEQRVLAKSVPLTKTFSKIQTAGGGSRIGHEFTVRLYEPDSNRDSKEVDKIPLREVEYRGSGGIRTTLDNPKFDANRGHLYETGPNTNVFEVKITIPRTIDGKPIHIGDWYEMRYIDRSTPSNTDEKIILEGRIG